MKFGGRNLLFAAAAVVFFAKLWQGPLGGDESCYALLAREILRSGDWAVLHHPAVPEWSNFYEHPPLYMWATAVAFRVGGVSDFMAKLFSASCGMLTLVAVYHAGRRIAGHRFAMIAGTILLTSLYFVDYARKARLEIPLACFFFLSFYWTLRAAQDRSSRSAVAAGIAAGAAFLTKGVPALAAMPIAAATLSIVGDGNSARDRLRWAALFLTGSAVVVGPWVALQLGLDEGRFFDWYTHRQVEWSVAGRPPGGGAVEHASSVGFYARKLFTEVMVPGALLALGGAGFLLRRRRWREDGPLWVCVLAALTVGGAFSLLSFHKARYLLPMVPFLALLGAHFVRELRFETRGLRVSTWILAGLLGLGLLLTAVPSVHFYTKKDGDFLPLVPATQRALGPADSLLVGGMREYTARQVFTWYFDRPLRVVGDARSFAQRWRSGQYRAGVLRVDPRSGSKPPGENQRSGPYCLYLRDFEAAGSGGRP